MRWDDLNARVRGMSAHLLGAAAIQSLAAEFDIDALARRLHDGPYDAGLRGALPSAISIDQSVRRAAAARLATLAKWAGPRIRRLTAIFEEEDRRSVRALLRGAAAGARPEARLSGLVPTPALPESALTELSRQPTAAKVAALLVAWGHPFGSPIFEHAGGDQPDLFLVELALAQAFAARARKSARNAELRRFTQDSIDCENASAAVALAGRKLGVASDRVFLHGGRRISKDFFLHVVAAQDAESAMGRLAWLDEGRSPFARGVAGATTESLERALLRFRIVHLKRIARMKPLGPALLLHYALRLRAEVMDLRTIAWGLILRAPRQLINDQLVTV